MNGTSGTMGKAGAVGGALLVAFLLLPALAGSASAASAPPAASPQPTQWAFGGQGWSDGIVSISGLNATWNATIGVAVIFTATPTAPGITELEEQRTVLVAFSLTASYGNLSGSYSFKGLEIDSAYANVTNGSTVYVGGVPVAALGILNASLSAKASLAESFAASEGSLHVSANVNVQGRANASIAFAPSLGLIPLNLTGVSAWNSTSYATTGGGWNITYNYQVQAPNGTTDKGMGGGNGSWALAGDVNLTGETFTAGVPHFHDHHARTGIALLLQGPADLYAGFIFVPHAFDFFGGAAHAYDSVAPGNATISSESLFVTGGQVGPSSFSAGEMTYGGVYSAPAAIVSGSSAAHPAVVSADPGATVVAQPETPQQAQSQATCFQTGCPTSPSWLSGLLAVGVVAGVVAVSIGAVAWIGSSRRKSRQQTQGGNGSQQTYSIPPGAAAPLPPSAVGSPPTGPNESNGRL
jgi:hypothetical protein